MVSSAVRAWGFMIKRSKYRSVGFLFFIILYIAFGNYSFRCAASIEHHRNAVNTVSLSVPNNGANY